MGEEPRPKRQRRRQQRLPWPTTDSGTNSGRRADGRAGAGRPEPTVHSAGDYGPCDRPCEPERQPQQQQPTYPAVDDAATGSVGAETDRPDKGRLQDTNRAASAEEEATEDQDSPCSDALTKAILQQRLPQRHRQLTELMADLPDERLQHLQSLVHHPKATNPSPSRQQSSVANAADCDDDDYCYCCCCCLRGGDRVEGRTSDGWDEADDGRDDEHQFDRQNPSRRGVREEIQCGSNPLTCSHLLIK